MEKSTASVPEMTTTLPASPAPTPTAWPEVMTPAEAAAYLRLNEIDVADPAATLVYYRRRGVLRGTQIGKCVRYRRVELERFLDRITDSNPR